jgi:hypothetical protein
VQRAERAILASEQGGANEDLFLDAAALEGLANEG